MFVYIDRWLSFSKMLLCLADDMSHILDKDGASKVHRAALTATNTAWQKIWEKASPLSTLTALGDLNNKKRRASEQTG